MNRKIWMNAAVAAALILGASTVHAQGPGPHHGGPAMGGPMELLSFEGES